MRAFLRTTWNIVRDPQAFFEQARDERWLPAYRYFLAIVVVLAILSPAAWALGVDGGSPVNTSLTAQRDTYRWWHDTLRPQFGNWSYPVAGLVLLLTAHIVLIIFTPVVHLVFRLLGGQGPLLHAWKSICYGMAPTIALGFLPFLGVLTGVYATLLQLAIAPATLYRLRDGRAYVLLTLILSISIAAFWQGVAP
jgi:hypothetical protein